MKRFPYALFAIIFAIDVAVPLAQRQASFAVQGTGLNVALQTTGKPWIWLALGMACVQLFVWTRILSRTDLSLASPLTALSCPLVMIVSTIWLGERITWQTWAGAMLITAGVIIVGLGAWRQERGTDSQP